MGQRDISLVTPVCMKKEAILNTCCDI